MNLGVLPYLRTSHGCALCIGLVSLLVAGVCSPAMAQNEDLFGRWDPPLGGGDPDGYTWPVKAIHAAHLPTDRILVWDHGWGEESDDPPRLWNPTDGSFTAVPNGVAFQENSFCSGHAALGDGSILIAGGGIQHAWAHDNAIIFRIVGFGPWEDAASLNSARWYPTCTTLSNGRVLATSGYNVMGPVSIPEIYDPDVGEQGEWNFLAGEEKELLFYPFMFVLPLENKVFFAGPVHTPLVTPADDASTWTLDVATGNWTFVANSPFLGACGSAVMYEPGKIMRCGGSVDLSTPAVATTWVVDLNNSDTPWLVAAPRTRPAATTTSSSSRTARSSPWVATSTGTCFMS